MQAFLLLNWFTMSGLASLTANYTDSEEEPEDEEQEPFQKINDGRAEEQKSLSLAPVVNPAPPVLVDSRTNSPGSSGRATPVKKTRLVSYTEEGHEDEDKDDDVVSMELDSGEEEKEDEVEPVKEADNKTSGVGDKEKEASQELSKSDVADKKEKEQQRHRPPTVETWCDGVRLPPEPPGECSRELQARIANLYRRRVETGYDMNSVIQNKKAFRNPSIYEKLIQFCDIDETGTNLPKELYDGHLFGPDSYYTELAKVQAIEMDKREKAAKARAEAAIAAVVNKKASSHSTQVVSSAGERRSKWDQPAAGMTSAPPVALPQARPQTNPNLPLRSVPPPQLVSAGAAAPPKTISAFGPLKK